MKEIKILIVDDNDRYAENLEKYFVTKKIATIRARTGKEGWELFNKEKFHTIITDVTMEERAAGMYLVRKIKNSGYKGNVIIASTAFDQFGVMIIGKYLLPAFGNVGWMIPKVPLKKGIVQFFPTIISIGDPKFD